LKTKLLALVVSLAIFAAILAPDLGTAQAAVGGPTCNVPTDYPTIQAAVNDAGCTTINVAPGVYVENVTIPRSLTLNGAQAGQPVVGRVSGGPLESTVQGANPIGSNPVISVQAANVTIDGFTLKNSITTNAAIGIAVKTAGNNALITNNFFDGITTSDTGGNGTAQAVYLENGPDGVKITKNDMRNIQSARSAKGVTIGDSSSTNPSTNVLIEGNSITSVTSVSRGAYGISVNNGNGATANSGLVIRDNSISALNGGGWVHAIGLEANTPGVLVVDNDISNLTSATPDSIAVWFESNPSFSTGQVHTNNFIVTAASYGIAVHPALALTGGSVSGTCNWWNSATGPTSPSNPGGTGAQVSSGVIFAPWLIAPAPGGACIGGNVATDKDQCKNDGYKNLTDANGEPFKNQGQCVSYSNHN
jgi:hypothetical protein